MTSSELMSLDKDDLVKYCEELQTDKKNLMKFIVNTNHSFDSKQILDWLTAKRKLEDLT